MVSYRVLFVAAISSSYFVARLAFAADVTASLPSVTNKRISCTTEAEAFFKQNPQAKKIFICGPVTAEKFCLTKTDNSCLELDVPSTMKTVNSAQKWVDPGNKKMARTFRDDSGPRKKVLATYLARMKFNKSIFIRPTLSIQTGRYPLVSVSKQALNTKCMTAIVQAAYRLNSTFPDYNFVVDSHIHNCHNLREGIKELLVHQNRVRSNLKKFHSPLHSIYLTNETKYVSQELGKMGLYVNVDMDGEIRRRLIKFDHRNIEERKIAVNAN